MLNDEDKKARRELRKNINQIMINILKEAGGTMFRKDLFEKAKAQTGATDRDIYATWQTSSDIVSNGRKIACLREPSNRNT